MLLAVALVAVALPLAASEDDFDFAGDKNFTGMFENAGGPPDGVGEVSPGRSCAPTCTWAVAQGRGTLPQNIQITPHNDNGMGI